MWSSAWSKPKNIPSSISIEQYEDCLGEAIMATYVVIRVVKAKKHPEQYKH